MLGKTAGGLFWMCRYLERIENGARLLDAGLRMALTGASSVESEWRSILTTMGALGAFEERNDPFETVKVVNFLLRDRQNPASIISNMKTARENARLARTALTREVWETTNEAWITLQALLKQPVNQKDLPDLLNTIRRFNALVRGSLAGTMLRNDGYNFTRLGAFIERADNTARILDVKYYLLLPSVADIGSSLDHIQWETILRSVSAHRAFQWLNGADISARTVADFLTLNEQMPRSLIFCTRKIADNLGYLEREYGASNQSCTMANDLSEKLQSTSIDRIFDMGLHEFLEGFIADNNRLASQIETDYRFLK